MKKGAFELKVVETKEGSSAMRLRVREGRVKETQVKERERESAQEKVMSDKKKKKRREV